MTPRARPARKGDASPGRATHLRQSRRRKGPRHHFTLDGREVDAREGETIWQVAKREGIDIPHLCYAPEPGYRADGNCRACMVEIEGERVLAASCIRKPAAGMKVQASNPSRRRPRARWCSSFWSPISPSARRRTIRFRNSGTGPTRWGSRPAAFPSARRARARPQPSGDGGQSRRLHPVQSLRPRLPRSAGQRRDRHGRPRP